VLRALILGWQGPPQTTNEKPSAKWRFPVLVHPSFVLNINKSWCVVAFSPPGFLNMMFSWVVIFAFPGIKTDTIDD